MLQQTQTDRVLPKYREFLRRFPSFRALAQAPLQEVLVAWQGLGYNRRALHLKRAAEIVNERYRGRLPRSEEALRDLPGVGAYTAAAVSVFAFDQPSLLVETNIRSVFLEHFFPGSGAVSDSQIATLVARTLDRRDPRSWYYALMDYGTMLKKQRRGINSRSLHYVRQAPFAGSDRQIRGAIVRLLIKNGARSFRALSAELKVPTERLQRCLDNLVAEGLLAENRRQFVIAA